MTDLVRYRIPMTTVDGPELETGTQATLTLRVTVAAVPDNPLFADANALHVDDWAGPTADQGHTADAHTLWQAARAAYAEVKQVAQEAKDRLQGYRPMTDNPVALIRWMADQLVEKGRLADERGDLLGDICAELHGDSELWGKEDDLAGVLRRSVLSGGVVVDADDLEEIITQATSGLGLRDLGGEELERIGRLTRAIENARTA